MIYRSVCCMQCKCVLCGQERGMLCWYDLCRPIQSHIYVSYLSVYLFYISYLLFENRNSCNEI